VLLCELIHDAVLLASGSASAKRLRAAQSGAQAVKRFIKIKTLTNNRQGTTVNQ
jgi:hypothetical protein